ncbi:DUF559 domain-containing protein [Baekduia soli]|uniref:DUF559 domain-containing protein n=1 Tax=Baekduia soli TaxID=496014 RepID=A0A5B8U021_9ACTN|nr:DUF559 domain-containing protein [Baekduia soli]QEC46321.1 DUF559 domain-containing protein [Baekduia soli]
MAGAQHGVVARRQLLEAGVPGHVVDMRVRTRRLLVLHRGVYSDGHRQLRREGHWLAAVMACGPAAVLSHGTAAAHWGIRDAPAAPVHVIAPRRSGPRRRAGVVGHRADLPDADRTVHRSVPVTSVPRTLLDLAARVRARELELAVRHAARARIFDLGDVHAAAARSAHHPGVPRLVRLLLALEGVGTSDLRSPMEVAFVQLCDDFGLPRPVANRIVEGVRVDFSWRGSTLLVETDGFAFHAMPTAFTQDRRRDQLLALAGYTVLRFTYAQVTGEPEAVAATVGTMLQRSWSC